MRLYYSKPWQLHEWLHEKIGCKHKIIKVFLIFGLFYRFNSKKWLKLEQ